MVEIWKDVVGYDGLYQVSNMGQVKSFKFGKEIILKNGKTGKNGSGYYQVNLFKNGKRKIYLVHRLVGIAFIPNPDNKPQINHIDGNKTNNRVDNLEWTTSKENVEHAFIKNLRNSPKGETHHNCKLTDIQVLEIIEKYSTGVYTHRELADEYNISKSVITYIINKKAWKHIETTRTDCPTIIE